MSCKLAVTTLVSNKKSLGGSLHHIPRNWDGALDPSNTAHSSNIMSFSNGKWKILCTLITLIVKETVSVGTRYRHVLSDIEDTK